MALINFNDVKVEKLSKIHKTDSFDCDDEDINEFLKEDALKWQEKKLTNTKIFIYNDEIIGFFCCSGDSIKLQMDEKKTNGLDDQPIKELPAMKIGRLGRDIKYNDKGVGSNILKWAIGYIQSISEHAGIRYITVDSYPEKVKWYESHGFVRNLHKDYEKGRNVSMRYDLHNPPLK